MNIKNILLILSITASVSLIFLGCYVNGHLNGDIYSIMLPAKMFGVPNELLKHGLLTFYTGQSETGWDGQFYYYIANDLWGSSNSFIHIDNPIYRYQRVGMGILVKAISVVLGQKWVSPSFYYSVYFSLVLICTLFLAEFLNRRAVPPWIALFWSLSISVQLTLLNLLPDAAADCFFLLAFIALFYDRLVFYSLAISLSLLCRESYVLIPALFLVINSYQFIFQQTKSSKIFLLNLVPVGVYVFWHWHIHKFPGEIAAIKFALLDPVPFRSCLKFLSTDFRALLDSPKIFTRGGMEFFLLICFLIVLILSVWQTITIFKSKNTSVNIKIFFLGGISLIFLYFFLGDTVMFDYTGYMKVLGMPILLIIFRHATDKRKLSKLLVLLLSIITICGLYPLKMRFIDAPPYIQNSVQHPGYNIDNCLKDYHYSMQILSISGTRKRNYLSRISDAFSPYSNIMNVNVKIVNKSTQPWLSVNGSKAINLSYHYLRDGLVIYDGLRTPLLHDLQPGESLTQNISVVMRGDGSELVPSPVQEGCSWFYMQNNK